MNEFLASLHLDKGTASFIAISLAFVALERLRPWRKEQALFRKGFLTDLAHITFNGYFFRRLFYSGASVYVAVRFANTMEALGIWDTLKSAVMKGQPLWIQFPVLFLSQDFMKYCVHNILHRVPFLWQFHKVHHSVQIMDWIGNMRYHWLEVVVYNSLLFIPLSFLGFNPKLFYFIALFEITIGHFNHSNIDFDIKWLGYVVNNPRFHIWHHAADDPKAINKNFGIMLSLWDWIFGTAYMPEGRVPQVLGFQGIERYPSRFLTQQFFPFSMISRVFRRTSIEAKAEG
ncbi:sterol desaturase family protein [bacterium]|nr:sterol desaturase family protein [bacterium]